MTIDDSTKCGEDLARLPSKVKIFLVSKNNSLQSCLDNNRTVHYELIRVTIKQIMQKWTIDIIGCCLQILDYFNYQQRVSQLDLN